MKLKQAKELVHGLMERVFGVFGLPYILHSDNGIEFVNNLIADTIKSRHDLENLNCSMKKQEVPGCKDVLRKETTVLK